jgi:hypothetical protein
MENTGFDYAIKPLEEFAKGSIRLVKRCTKPDKKGENARRLAFGTVCPGSGTIRHAPLLHWCADHFGWLAQCRIVTPRGHGRHKQSDRTARLQSSSRSAEEWVLDLQCSDSWDSL